MLLCFTVFIGEAYSQASNVVAGYGTSYQDDDSGINLVPAKFQGGDYHDLEKWIGERIFYKRTPNRAHRQKLSASFFVDADGRVTDVKILKAPAKAYYRKLAEILEQSPQWIPGTDSGKPVPTEYAVEVNLAARSVKVSSYIDGEFVMPAFPTMKPEKSNFYTLLSSRQRGEFEMFMGWAMRQMIYPMAASGKGIEGIVEAEVYVDQHGTLKVTDIKSTPHPSLSNEVVRVIDRQKWVPGSLDGIDIPMSFVLPFKFSLR